MTMEIERGGGRPIPGNPRIRAIGSVLLGILLFSCAPVTREVAVLPEPSVTFRALRALVLNQQHADLELEMEVENPGPDLVLENADYQILAQGRSFATGKVALHVAVPRGSRVSVVLPVQLLFLDLPPAARGRLKRDDAVQMVARGLLMARSGLSERSVEFAGEAELKETAAP